MRKDMSIGSSCSLSCEEHQWERKFHISLLSYGHTWSVTVIFYHRNIFHNSTWQSGTLGDSWGMMRRDSGSVVSEKIGEVCNPHLRLLFSPLSFLKCGQTRTIVRLWMLCLDMLFLTLPLRWMSAMTSTSGTLLWTLRLFDMIKGEIQPQWKIECMNYEDSYNYE